MASQEEAAVSPALCMDAMVTMRTPQIGEHLTALPKTGKKHDKYTVSVTKHGVIVMLTPRV